jgi:hypothetical protein
MRVDDNADFLGIWTGLGMDVGDEGFDGESEAEGDVEKLVGDGLEELGRQVLDGKIGAGKHQLRNAGSSSFDIGIHGRSTDFLKASTTPTRSRKLTADGNATGKTAEPLKHNQETRTLTFCPSVPL